MFYISLFKQRRLIMERNLHFQGLYFTSQCLRIEKQSVCVFGVYTAHTLVSSSPLTNHPSLLSPGSHKQVLLRGGPGGCHSLAPSLVPWSSTSPGPGAAPPAARGRHSGLHCRHSHCRPAWGPQGLQCFPPAGCHPRRRPSTTYV